MKMTFTRQEKHLQEDGYFYNLVCDFGHFMKQGKKKLMRQEKPLQICTIKFNIYYVNGRMNNKMSELS